METKLRESPASCVGKPAVQPDRYTYLLWRSVYSFRFDLSAVNCEFPALLKGTPCNLCGFRLPRDYESPPKRNCGVESRCRHLGGATGVYELIPCPTCQGNVRQKFAIHSCAQHGECLPTRTGESERMSCPRCRIEGLGYEPT